METVSLELAKTAVKIVNERELLNLKAGQSLLICADTSSDSKVVDAVANAAYALDVKVAVIWFAAESFQKKTVPKPVLGAMASADAILELTRGSSSRDVMKEMKESGIRCVTLGGHHYFADAETLIRVVGKVNYSSMVELGRRLVQLTKKAKMVRMANPAGTDVSYEMDPQRPIVQVGTLSPARLLAGLVAWAPIEESVNGTIIVDGCILEPPIEHRFLRTPIELLIKDGIISEIKGDVEAKMLREWFESFQDPRMYNIAHFSYGLNPGTTINGPVIEGEHLFGGTTPAFGWQNPAFNGKFAKFEPPRPAHCDCVVLNVSTWLDGEQIQKDGRFIHPELTGLSKELEGT